MKALRTVLVVDAIALGLILWLYGGDVLRYVRARQAEVAALTELPLLAFAVPVLVLALVGLGVVVQGVRAGRSADYKGFRLLPILLLLALFVDRLVIHEGGVPLSSADQSTVTLHLLGRHLSQLSTQLGVPKDAAALEPIIGQLGQPPYLVRGERPARYGLQVRTGCEAPISEAPGAQPGTLLYCVAKDGRQAWITLVGLPAEREFGAAEVFSRGGDVQVAVVSPGPPAEGDEVATEAGGTGAPEGPEASEWNPTEPFREGGPGR